MKEIVLPIKCSTLKDVYENMIIITIAMIVITSFVITVSWWDVQYYLQPSNFGILFIFTTAGVVCGFVILTALLVIYDNLPSLTCIKDEETK